MAPGSAPPAAPVRDGERSCDRWKPWMAARRPVTAFRAFIQPAASFASNRSSARSARLLRSCPWTGGTAFSVGSEGLSRRSWHLSSANMPSGSGRRRRGAGHRPIPIRIGRLLAERLRFGRNRRGGHSLRRFRRVILHSRRCHDDGRHRDGDEGEHQPVADHRVRRRRSPTIGSRSLGVLAPAATPLVDNRAPCGSRPRAGRLLGSSAETPWSIVAPHGNANVREGQNVAGRRAPPFRRSIAVGG